MTGTTLAQYRIDAEIGRGGMGIVYRAQDTKLNRTVAIKVLPASALTSEDDRARFFREAQSAAQLSHPNIATVYQIDEAVPVDADGKPVNESDGPRPFIAMEFIEGDTLADYLKKGPMKLTEAINVASQVAEALRAAHGKDIVHRDIKAANVMLTPDGVAKVLDFGLAKTNQSTMLTRLGSTMGTVAYMSPEQARGQEVDGRSDLYSLGTMLYEMVAGRMPFAGDYEQAVVYGILNETPEPLTALRTGVPMGVEWIVNKLLAKEPDYRYQTAADLLADLKTVDLTGSGMSRRTMPAMSAAHTIATGATPISRQDRKPVLVAVALVLVALVAGSLAGHYVLAPKPAPLLARVLPVSVPSFTFAGLPSSSPDGVHWSYWAADSTGTIEIRIWNTLENSHRVIPGTADHFYTAFSPTGAWLATYGRDGLFRVRVPGGRPLQVAGPEIQSFRWVDDGHMLVVDDSLSFWTQSVESGERTPMALTISDSTITTANHMQAVPGTDESLILVNRSSGRWDVLWVDPEAGTWGVVIQDVLDFRMGPSNQLVYLIPDESGTTGQLVAQPYDPSSRSLTGVAVDVISDPMSGGSFGIGPDDTFLAVSRDTRAGFLQEARISVVDPDRPMPDAYPLPSGLYDRFSPSPDGAYLAVQRTNASGDGDGDDIIIYDVESASSRRLTYANRINRAPVWASTGIIYYSTGPAASDATNIYSKRADGSGPEERVVPGGDYPDVTADGRWLAYTASENGGDLWAVDLKEGTRVAIDTTATRAGDAAFSPDGRFIAYSVSDARSGSSTSNDQRVFIRSFPDPERFSVQLVDSYADDPIWSQDGRYLYFRRQGVLFRIGVEYTSTFRVTSTPEQIVSFPGANNMRVRRHPDGQRLIIKHAGSAAQDALGETIQVILNFSSYVDGLIGGR